MSENKQHNALGQAAGLRTFTPIGAPTRFSGYHLDHVCGARLTVGAYIAPDKVRHYESRCPARKRLSRPWLLKPLFDCATMAQALALAGHKAAAQLEFSCEPSGAPGVKTRHWAAQNLFCSWHDVMRAGAARL